MGINRRVDDQSNLVAAINRLVDRDKGNDTQNASQVRWVHFDGDDLDPHGGGVLSSNNRTLLLRNTVGRHGAVLLSGTDPDTEPTAANSVLLLDDDGAFIGNGKALRLYDADGTDYTEMTADADGGLAVGGSGTRAGVIAATAIELGAAPATTGAVRLTNAEAITARNAAGTQDISLLVTNSSNHVLLGDIAQSPTTLVQALTDIRLKLGAVEALTLTGAGLLTLPVAGSRIAADLSNATLTSRLLFQSSTAGGISSLGVVPNGAGATADLTAYNTAAPASAAVAATVMATATDMQLRADSPAATFLPMTFWTSALERMRVTQTGQVLIGDTLNAASTLGLTINQGAADNEILSLKSSDVAHGATAVSETDTFGYAMKDHATNGGLRWTGVADGGSLGIKLNGIAAAEDTTRGTTATGAVHIAAFKTSGTGVAALAANGNLLVVGNVGNAQFLVDAEGDTHYNGVDGAGAWDDYDDVALLEALRVTTAPGVEANYRQRFSENVAEHTEILERTGVLTMNEDGRHFVSTKGLNGLLIDSVRQLYGRLLALQADVRALTGGPHG